MSAKSKIQVIPVLKEMFNGVSNWAPYWQFHFGEGGFQIGHPIGSFILGREGGF